MNKQNKAELIDRLKNTLNIAKCSDHHARYIMISAYEAKYLIRLLEQEQKMDDWKICPYCNKMI